MTVLIAGAGPAGCSAAMWLTDLGIQYVWIDSSDSVGGTLKRVGNPIRNYPGVVAENGPALVEAIRTSLEHVFVKPRFGTALGSVQPNAAGVLCEYAGVQIQHQAVIIALGTRPRLLGLPSESGYRGRGVEISVTRNLPRYAGQEVCVVGGGDAALEGSLLLADVSPLVHLVHRRQAFRGQTRFVEAVRAHERIRIHQSEVVGLRGGDSLEAVTLASGEELPASGLFVRIGVEPVAPVGVATSTAGYIVVDDLFRTSARRVYACGDAASPAHQSAAWAAGSAGAAVRSLMDELSVSRTG